MIKIVEGDVQKRLFDCSCFFEIDTEIKSVFPCKSEAYPGAYTANIEIYDEIGRMFTIIRKPPVTPYYLGAMISYVRKDLQEEFFELGASREIPIFDSACCVDPRIIMVHTLVWWRCPYNEEERIKLLGEAFTPPPTYEEAQKWLVDNRFIGPNALREDGYPGRWVYAFDTPKTFKNLPEKYLQAIDKICELIEKDETLSKEEKESDINDWRIPKA